jgi:hypothetical protein
MSGVQACYIHQDCNHTSCNKFVSIYSNLVSCNNDQCQVILMKCTRCWINWLASFTNSPKTSIIWGTQLSSCCSPCNDYLPSECFTGRRKAHCAFPQAEFGNNNSRRATNNNRPIFTFVTCMANMGCKMDQIHPLVMNQINSSVTMHI